ncbi:MAG: hypothetical protein JJD98_02360 [Polaromonas sp.]|nr:hypothetical protein [Polaromonas sp.]
MTCKIDKIHPRPTEFSLRFFKPDRLLDDKRLARLNSSLFHGRRFPGVGKVFDVCYGKYLFEKCEDQHEFSGSRRPF